MTAFHSSKQIYLFEHFYDGTNTIYSAQIMVVLLYIVNIPLNTDH